MKIFTLLNIAVLSLFFILNQLSVVKASISSSTENYRMIRHGNYTQGQYYFTVKYEFDITPTNKSGRFQYYAYGHYGVYTLLLNSTEYELWNTKYYNEWLNDPTHDLNRHIAFVGSDLRRFMCTSGSSACQQDEVRYSDRDLYIVVIKNPTYDSATNYEYKYKDNFEKFKDLNVAQLLYDPGNPPVTSTLLSTALSTSVNESATSIGPSSTNQSNATGTNGFGSANGNNSNGINKNDDQGSWWWYLIGGSIIFVLALAAVLLAINNRKKERTREVGDLQDEDQMIQSGSGSESSSKVVAYNPHNAVKRVAYNYNSNDVNFSRDNIVEITKRYNDGWASAINPKDGNECMVPLIILEGDLSEDLTNIPYEEKSSMNILATPESLYENKYISQKDYEEMKRNDEWMKKVKLMKHAKPESAHKVENDQIKYVSHPMPETIENEIDSNQSKIGGNRKSMVATVVNSNTELLNADHILEVCEEEYEEPEEGVIMKDDL